MKIPKASHDPILNEYFNRLYRHFGSRKWWPAETPFEILVGAVLTQNTSWKNVEKAIRNLKDADALDPITIHRMNPSRLASLIRPSGYFRLKARRLKSVVKWYVQNYGGRIERLAQAPLSRIRDELLQTWGVGPETADSILCYAAKRKTFVIDLYTKRVLTRHGLQPEDTDYERMKEYFESRLLSRHAIYNEFHALMVGVGSRFCGPTPRCEGCPLEPLLPDRKPSGHLEKYPSSADPLPQKK